MKNLLFISIFALFTGFGVIMLLSTGNSGNKDIKIPQELVPSDDINFNNGSNSVKSVTIKIKVVKISTHIKSISCLLIILLFFYVKRVND